MSAKTPVKGLTPHARWLRAAALAFESVARAAVSGGVPGAVDGLLRLETQAGSADAMQEIIARLGLPAQYVQALTAAPKNTISAAWALLRAKASMAVVVRL